MKKIVEGIQNILKQAEITEGIVLDTTNYFSEKRNQELIQFEKAEVYNLIEKIEQFSNVRAIVLESEMFENEELLKMDLIKVIRDKQILCIVCTRNPIDQQTAFELLSGKRKEVLNIHGYTEAGIRELMEKQGGQLWIEEKVMKEKQKDSQENTFLASGSMLHQYLEWVSEFTDAELDVEYFIQAYKIREDYSEKNVFEKNKNEVFLSVITRTQGKRLQALSETLLSLAGQSCMDFEVLVMAHNVNDQEKKNIIEIIEETPAYLKEKIRFIPVYGGNRSTPINKGFEAAKGRYAVLLDDDDIVFDHWVSSFKDAENKHPGSVLHAYVIAQDWCAIQTKTGEEMLRACGSPQSQFCREFHWIDELVGNYCPILGMAFPLFPFRNMNIRFDETLDTTEDWDYIMRISSLCGVVDIKEPTSMYRLWKNVENSHSLHSDKEWSDNRKKIQNRFRKKPLLLPAKYVDDLIRVTEKNPKLFEKTNKKERNQITTIYYDDGSGFSEQRTVKSGSRTDLPNVHYEFTSMEEMGEISCIRWDPYEAGNVWVENVVIQIIGADGEKIVKTIHHMWTNGFKVRNGIVFFHPDPQIVVKLGKKMKISKVIITGLMKREIPEEMHDYLAMRYDKNVIYKSKKAIKIVGKKLMNK